MHLCGGFYSLRRLVCMRERPRERVCSQMLPVAHCHDHAAEESLSKNDAVAELSFAKVSCVVIHLKIATQIYAKNSSFGRYIGDTTVASDS